MPAAVATLLRTTVESGTLPAGARHQKERVRAFEETRDFYRKRRYQPAWSDVRGPLPRAQELVAAIDGLAVEALDPRQYDQAGLQNRLREARWEGRLDDPTVQRRLADLDVTLTYNFLVMAAHTAIGRLQPETLQTGWYTKPRNVDLDVVLTRALGPDGIKKALASVTPQTAGYARLREARARYGEIVKRGGWPEVPSGPPLKTGTSGERVRILRARLADEGDLPAAAPGAVVAGMETRYDDLLANAVTRFQARHGLAATGAVDADTLAALNVPVAARLRQIGINMERWRWMPNDLGSRYILVNVPEFELKLVDGGRPALQMRVIVGKAQSKTPAFSNRITRIDLNPVWHLPPSIVQNEVAPAVARDPGYLARKHLEVVKGWGADAEAIDPGAVDWARMGKGDYPYRLRQPSGPDNALGRIKFVVPDQFDVYLHDTPSTRLFAAAKRDLSHGCVRVEHPVDLAAYLLKDDPEWSPEAIQEAIESEETQSLPLPQPIAVHILYWTAWVDEDGTVQFRKDVYGHDADLDRALAAEPKVALDPEALRGEKRAAVPEKRSLTE
ncbi:MAG TPA: L,D-transpeptidase family protein [Thermoanaerobaculia bacterium]|nr:L,D-transpeptidase family protein [Thermoanaerobaculia bacterium]